MAEFVLEHYVSRSDGDAVGNRAERARLAAEELSREGQPVRYLRSMFVPDDETCFFVYEAASIETVREAARRSALSFERLVEVISAEGTASTAAMRIREEP